VIDRTRDWRIYRDTDGRWWLQLQNRDDDKPLPRRPVYRVHRDAGTEHWVEFADDWHRSWVIPR
jgi:hypothetical protein